MTLKQPREPWGSYTLSTLKNKTQQPFQSRELDEIMMGGKVAYPQTQMPAEIVIN